MNIRSLHGIMQFLFAFSGVGALGVSRGQGALWSTGFRAPGFGVSENKGYLILGSL